MDTFVAKLSQHATSFAIRSCFALTSQYVAKQAGSLLKTVDDGPLRRQLDTLQKRLARKIELLSPILESIELRYAQGETALEAIIKISEELREDIDALEARILVAQPSDHGNESGLPSSRAVDSVEILAIIDDLKALITSIDDTIPLVNLWVSSLGTTQPQSAPFSPSRLLQASMLLNIADSQFVLSPFMPMQIGPDFYVSLYMLFRGHASLRSDEEPYGVGEGQRKPLWQEVMRKARVRLCRTPREICGDAYSESHPMQAASYRYQLQIVEDLNDGLLHTPDEHTPEVRPFDGVLAAGIRQIIPIAEVSKLLYTEVGRLLNIVPEDDRRSNPVLLLKREIQTYNSAQSVSSHHQEATAAPHRLDSSTLSDDDDKDQCQIDRQLAAETGNTEITSVACFAASPSSRTDAGDGMWQLPSNLDPEWMALEMYMPDETDGSCSDTSSQTADDINGVDRERIAGHGTADDYPHRSRVDTNLCNQFSRMSVAPRETQRPESPSHSASQSSGEISRVGGGDLARATTKRNYDMESRALLRRSPFGAIMTSLSLLEMLLRLTSLQEFEQKTHLAIPDQLLRFYLDESASTSGLRGQQRASAKREAEAKMGFDPYMDGNGGKRG